MLHPQANTKGKKIQQHLQDPVSSPPQPNFNIMVCNSCFVHMVRPPSVTQPAGSWNLLSLGHKFVYEYGFNAGRHRHITNFIAFFFYPEKAKGQTIFVQKPMRVKANTVIKQLSGLLLHAHAVNTEQLYLHKWPLPMSHSVKGQ